jgi:hypothetical protein
VKERASDSKRAVSPVNACQRSTATSTYWGILAEGVLRFLQRS